MNIKLENLHTFERELNQIERAIENARHGPLTYPPKAEVTETSKREAHTFLGEAKTVLEARARLRDAPGGERTMKTIVETFNALTGHKLTVAEGWEFMVILKMARGRQGKYNADDYVDGASYFALLGEEESQSRTPPVFKKVPHEYDKDAT